MKRIVILLFVFALFTSCEDVVEIDLNTSDPRLVIEASINLMEDGTSNSTVKLSLTAPFFDDQIPTVEDASVMITGDNGIIYSFSYIDNGIYESSLVPQSGINYTLEVIYNGETYSATEQIVPVSSLEFVEQNNDGGFSGEDIELKVFFTDPLGPGNHYFFEGISEHGFELDTFFDEFFDGNQIFAFYSVEDLAAGDVVRFNLYGVNEQFYNFMFILLQQGSDQGGGPFETQPATVRGNMINETNIDNFPLGYFRVSEVSTLIYTVQ
jgi:hypothetical protein|tara:strand:+ start:980 stop:1780 length:801 start_codon:yes stop_codon:yes gene_type:complete